jgi:hypothetical protein
MLQQLLFSLSYPILSGPFCTADFTMFNSKDIPNATMSNISDIPKVNMANLNIISDAVVTLGPMWKQLPCELVLLIIKYIFLQHPWSKPGLVVDKNRFDIVNRMGKLIKLRHLASKTCSVSVMEYFYAGNDFVFKAFPVQNCEGPWCMSLPPAFPPVLARGFLRRIQVHLAFESLCIITMPVGYNKLNGHTSQRIQSAHDLFKYCTSARILRTLTRAGTGFGNLDRLDLHLEVDFDESALAIFREAAFAVRARTVAITVYNVGRYSLPASRREAAHLSDLVDAIAVQH